MGTIRRLVCILFIFERDVLTVRLRVQRVQRILIGVDELFGDRVFEILLDRAAQIARAILHGIGPVSYTHLEYSVEEGQKFAQNCMLNVLAVLEKKIGDLNRVADVVKILVFVASADDFYSQPQVANGASNLLVSLFGEDAGAPTRSAVGMNVLPGNIPVEIEAIFKIK